MPTVAAHNVQTNDAPQVLDTRGARNLEVTIGTAGVLIAFAYNIGGMRGTAFGVEEPHAPKLLNISDEAIDAVQVRSLKAGTPASVIIIATT